MTRVFHRISDTLQGAADPMMAMIGEIIDRIGLLLPPPSRSDRNQFIETRGI